MYILPGNYRERFREPFGTLYPDLEPALPFLEGKILYAVGDVVTHNLLLAGITPDIAVIDGKTRREIYKGRDISDEKPLFTVINPPGTITEELIATMQRAVEMTPALIFVEGEDDLAVIPLVIHGKEGAAVLYGQPDEGVVVCTIDEPSRERARNLFSLFEKKDLTAEAGEDSS